MRRIMMSLVLGMILCSFSSAFAADPTMKADAQNIYKACAPDSVNAACGDEKVGTGLLKCLHEYKKTHHKYKFSDTCKDAMKQMRRDHKAKK